MSNRGYQRRRRRKRITGRFYAFLTVVLVLCVMTGVIIANRRPSNATFTPAAIPQANVNAPTVVNSPAVNQVAQTPAPGQDVSAVDSVAPAQDTDAQNGVSTINQMIENDPDLAPLTGSDKVEVSDFSVTPGLSSDWRNILLLGSDARDLKKASRTDTIIIASVNVKDGRIKLTSIMRDTIIPVPTQKGVIENKINSASYYGGVELTIKLVNEYFGMNITEYVMVNFASFQQVVDILGGIEVDITKEEMEYINKSIGEQAKIAGEMEKAEFLEKKDSMLLKTFGNATHLTGTQALGYARIRKLDSDYQRTDRQRKVIDAILQKVRKDASAIQLMQLATSMWGYIDTNVNMMSAVGLATTVIKNGATKMENWRLPAKDTYVSETRNKMSALYDVNYEECTRLLHKFIYET